MGELCDEWSTFGKRNIWGTVPRITQMQSEAGVAGAVHGSLQAGALTTTFTASQGLLLMIPNLYKIAGELTPFCMHVAARTLATHALSIFGDHSDVMACRQAGLAMLCSSTVQEAHDFACIGQTATLNSRVPVLHFFDGFRTSHEINKIAMLEDDQLRAMLDPAAIREFRDRALSPDHPVVRGTAQNPDTFFQAREASNVYYDRCPEVFSEAFARFAELTGRSYQPFSYVGHPDADRVIVVMGSGASTARETAFHLLEQGHRVGVVTVHLYRPFSLEHLLAVLPQSTRVIAALDRTKEPGSLGEPLYLDLVAALQQARDKGALQGDLASARVVGGRYGLSSKEFTPAMVAGVFEELAGESPSARFTVGIEDDVTNLSIDYPAELDIESADVVRAVFYGLGSDGTVGANKNSIKIICENEDRWGQGYFVYDSKKSGAMTVSHLRFGPDPIGAAYQIDRAGFVACHHAPFMERLDVLEKAAPGATFLLNTPYPPDEVWDTLPRDIQARIRDLELEFWVVDALAVASESGMGRRINTVMQTCFFALSGALPRDEAIDAIKAAIEKTYAKKGAEIVRRNFAAVDAALSHLHQVAIPPAAADTGMQRAPLIPEHAPDFVQKVTAVMLADQGDSLPVSAFPPDGTWPVGTARWEKRSIAHEIPIWDADLCIQCNKCAFVCPHAAIRAKIFAPEASVSAPESFISRPFRSKDHTGLEYTLQVAPEDCTGCSLCVVACPAKDKAEPRRKAINMQPLSDHRDRERDNFDHFLEIPEIDRAALRQDPKHSQFLEPLFEFSGACAGCGETPYVKLLTQLFGDRALIANATGCSSIYGGNLPTTPYCTNSEGRGPAWSNSLFEDNAEFGLGFRLAIDQQKELARTLLQDLAAELPDDLVAGILATEDRDEATIAAQRERVAKLRTLLPGLDPLRAGQLDAVADALVPRSVWIMGGDGWAYDIGYGGLDHVLSLGLDVNILVLDTEVYSNTGGQQSKATPMGAAAKFAAAGKTTGKKDLGLMAMAYGNVYVAQIAFGANDRQTVKALLEAEAYPGPSLIIAYSHCIAHGYDLSLGLDQQARAVDSGYWPLFRYDPVRGARGETPLNMDSKAPRAGLEQFARNEGRFRMVERQDPARFRDLMQAAQQRVSDRFGVYQQLAQLTVTERQQDTEA
jgi:pyruvate-ferredoxin/flavodoxin oxidoreductase